MICKISLRVELWNWSWGLYRYETHSYEYFHVMKKKRIHLVSYNIYTYIKKNPMTKDEVKFSFLLAYRIPNFTWVRILFSFLFSSFRFFFLVKIINRWSIYVKLWLNIKAPSLHLHEVLFFEAAIYERLLQKCSLSFQLEGYIKNSYEDISLLIIWDECEKQGQWWKLHRCSNLNTVSMKTKKQNKMNSSF